MLHPERQIRALILAGIVFALVSCEPQDYRPGFWLSGEGEQTPVTD